MKIIISVKTGKRDKSTEKEIDQTVDEVMRIALKIKGKVVGGKCYCDGTSMILAQN